MRTIEISEAAYQVIEEAIDNTETKDASEVIVGQHDLIDLLIEKGQPSESEILIREEMKRAREKFPTNKQMLHAFTEEAGEVTKAFLDLQQGKCDQFAVRKEIIQAACTAIRLLEEGDPEFPQFVPIGKTIK